MIKDIAFVGYPTKDMKKAREFYEGVLGLVPSDEFGPVTEESNFIEYAVGTGTFSLGNMDKWTPSNDGPSAAFEVDNFDELISTLKEKGMKFMMEPETFPSCRMGIVYDPDGNALIIHQKNATK